MPGNVPTMSVPYPHPMFVTGSFLPTDVANLVAWYKFNTGITITGAGVSQWDDQSGNGRHLLQGTDADRPSESGGVITFDGVRELLKVTAFTLNQPETIYILFKSVTDTLADRIFDGNSTNAGMMDQDAGPSLNAYAGGFIGKNLDYTGSGTYLVATCQFNGAASKLQVNSGTPVTGNGGASNMGGFQLGGTGTNQFSNISVLEVVITDTTADDATAIATMETYLQGVLTASGL